MTKCLFEIDSFNLCKPVADQPCFFPSNMSILIQILHENPFCVNEIFILRSQNQFPSIILLNLVQLFVHSSYPMFIMTSLFKFVWFKCDLERNMGLLWHTKLSISSGSYAFIEIPNDLS